MSKSRIARTALAAAVIGSFLAEAEEEKSVVGSGVISVERSSGEARGKAKRKPKRKTVGKRAERSNRALLEGFFVGFGASYGHQNADVQEKEFWIEYAEHCDDAEAAAAFDVLKAGGWDRAERRGQGILCGKSFGGTVKGANCGLGGFFVLGWGRFVGDGAFYLGVEAGLDARGDRKLERRFSFVVGGDDANGLPAEERYASYAELKSCGVVPSVRFRFGYYLDSLGSMLYATFGACRLGAELKGIEKDGKKWKGDFSLKKIVPTIGFGFEKIVFSRSSIRFELDYRFRTDRTGTISMVDAGADDIKRNFVSKIKTGGYVVRLTFNCHI